MISTFRMSKWVNIQIGSIHNDFFDYDPESEKKKKWWSSSSKSSLAGSGGIDRNSYPNNVKIAVVLTQYRGSK